MERYVRAAPKAELHLHLPGAVRLGTLLALARRHGVGLPLPADATETQARARYGVTGIDRFLEVYAAIRRCLCTADDFALVVWEMGEALARQRVRYAEVTVSPASTPPWEAPSRWPSPASRGAGRASGGRSASSSTGSSTSSGGATRSGPGGRTTSPGGR